MIPFRLFYAVYLRYFLTNLFFTAPCYYLFTTVKYLYGFNSIQISIIWNTLMIICVMGCYKLILKEMLFGPYDKIVVKTKITSISWKFTFYTFGIAIIILILHVKLFNTILCFVPTWISHIIGIIVDYFFINVWLERYARMEISTK